MRFMNCVRLPLKGARAAGIAHPGFQPLGRQAQFASPLRSASNPEEKLVWQAAVFRLWQRKTAPSQDGPGELATRTCSPTESPAGLETTI